MIDLQYPPQYKTIDPDELARIVNGCGPGNWKFDFIPDKITKHNVKPACDIHDLRYHLGGTEEDRLVADLEFLHNLVVLCSVNGEVDLIDLDLCIVYFTAVRKFGAKYFGRD